MHLLLALIACLPVGVSDDDGTKHTEPQDSEGSDEIELVGCQDPSNWRCDEPSPGYEYGCVAVCDDRIELTCNQEYDGGYCILNSGDRCEVPRDESGCAICFAAIVADCAAYIEP